MAKIDPTIEQRIKEAASIVDVVSDYVQLKRSGAEFTGRCPFHDDRHTGSFMVSPKKNIATCFPCNETWNPVDFVMKIENLDYPDALRWLGKKYCIEVEGAERFNVKPNNPRPLPPPERPKEKRYWPISWVTRFKADDSDTFVSWVKSIPWREEQRNRVEQVLNNYGVGHSRFTDDYGTQHDFTIFWMIDHEARLCNGHLMKYQCDGHRVKDKNLYPTTWIHARMKRAAKNPFDEATQEPAYCLFGQHMLNLAPDATINIVESEKAAIIMAIAYGSAQQNLWMACTGLSNLTNSRHLLAPLIEQGRRIVLYPDRDGVETWHQAAREIDYGRLTVNDTIVTKWWTEADGQKAGPDDIILRIISTTHNTSSNDRLLRMCEENPALDKLIKHFNLKEI